MGDQKRLSRYQRYRARHQQPTYEEEGLMLLLGLRSLQDLRQWFKARENGLLPGDLLDLREMKPPDEALDLAMREAEEEEDEAEEQEGGRPRFSGPKNLNDSEGEGMPRSAQIYLPPSAQFELQRNEFEEPRREARVSENS